MKANVRRFHGPTAKDVMAMVKAEIGPHAVVLKNRSVDGGVEMLVMEPEEAEKIVGPMHSQTPEDEDFKVTFSEQIKKSRRAEPQITKNDGSDDLIDYKKSKATHPEFSVPTGPANPTSEVSGEVARQLAQLRSLIEVNLSGLAWGKAILEAPERAQLIGEMLESGFSAALARKLLEYAELPTQSSPGLSLRSAVTAILKRQLNTLGNDNEMIDRGGIYALVGPTGVGKTTTTAKLAARCVVRHGASKVALITTDAYRIGAQDQLKTFGKILGVSVYTVRDAEQLRSSLNELSGKHMILIDTVGMSQRDNAVVEQAAMLSGAGVAVKRLLCLNSSTRGEVLEEVIKAYKGPDLAGCVFTKVDETISLAPVLDVMIRHSLKLFYVATGQRVPEDLHLPNTDYLIHKSLKPIPAASYFKMVGDEPGLFLAAAAANSGKPEEEVKNG